MTVELGVGDVLHWEGFKFGDGVIRNKFFVVLGAKAGRDCLVVIATSQHKGKSYEAGCHPNEGYYLIPGGSKDFFSEDTWLLLMECRVLSFAEFGMRPAANNCESRPDSAKILQTQSETV